ncbi:MAG: hypothetical protein WCT54_04760 [Patescibacteria group bacterium]|jgi:hypothetical protein
MKIIITQDHIDKGNHDTASYNAVCLAIADAVGQRVIGVRSERGVSKAVFFKPDGKLYAVPAEAWKFLETLQGFTGTEDVAEAPFVFEFVFP